MSFHDKQQHKLMTRELARALTEAGYMTVAEYVRLYGEKPHDERSPGLLAVRTDRQ